jgi:hypothetical protein
MAVAIDGQFVFGISTSVVVADNPRAAQRNEYPGLNGVEELDQGHRGRIITISGRLVGDTGIDVGSAEADIRSFNDGAVHEITDQFGTTWQNCKYESFEPQGLVRVGAGLVGPGVVYHRRYVARFRTLT